MVRTGTRPKFKISTLKQQRENAQLELIIDKFGRTMRAVHRPYIAAGDQIYCCHRVPPFTANMRAVWNEYIAFCTDHPNE